MTIHEFQETTTLWEMAGILGLLAIGLGICGMITEILKARRERKNRLT